MLSMILVYGLDDGLLGHVVFEKPSKQKSFTIIAILSSRTDDDVDEF